MDWGEVTVEEVVRSLREVGPAEILGCELFKAALPLSASNRQQGLQCVLYHTILYVYILTTFFRRTLVDLLSCCPALPLQAVVYQGCWLIH